VYFCGKTYPECDSIEDKIKEHNIDCLLIYGLPTRDYLYRDYSKLDVFKVNILFDYNIFEDGSTYEEYNKFLERSNFDLILCHNKISFDKLKDKYNVRLTKLSVPTSFYHPEIKDVDIMSSGSTNVRFYKGRKELNVFLKSMKELNVITKVMEFDKYVHYLGKSILFINYGNHFRTNCVSLKYLEAMASGTLFITTKPVNLEEYGFVNGEHLIIYNDFNDLKDKIDYYLTYSLERQKIVNAAMEHVHSNFTNDIVIKNMLRDIEECRKN